MALTKLNNRSIGTGITADNLDVGQLGGRRNLLINGGFDVWQRGTSFDITTSTFHADHWTAREASVSRSTDVPSNEGFKYSMFYDNDGTRAGINFRQKIEDGKRTTDGKPLTLSFWIKGSSASSGCSVDFGDQQSTSFNLTTSWQQVIISVSGATRNINNIFGGAMWVDFNLGGDYPDVYITGVQLELGTVATPFEHRSYGEELTLCQRYFQKLNDGTQENVGVATVESTTTVRAHRTLPVVMRANPSVVTLESDGHYRFNGDHDQNNNGTDAVGDVIGPSQVSIRIGGFSSLQSGEAGQVRGQNGQSCGLDAEI